MNSKPRMISFLIARLVIVLSAVFSAINLAFIFLDIPRTMPMALSMTGYLAKTGVSLSTDVALPFFSIYSVVLSGIVCFVFMLCALLAGVNRGWLLTGTIIAIADCIGIALIIVSGGFRSGYWFEIAGHAVIIAALIVALFTAPRKVRADI